MMWSLFSYTLLNLEEEVVLGLKGEILRGLKRVSLTTMFVLCHYIWKLQLSFYFWLFRYTMYTSLFSVGSR